MLRRHPLGTLLATTALACTPAPQAEPTHSPAPTHRDSAVIEPRSDCASLAEKLCLDLGESPACAAVRSGTPKLAPSKCVEIRAHYADVLADLRKMNQRFEVRSISTSSDIRPFLPLVVHRHPGWRASLLPSVRILRYSSFVPFSPAKLRTHHSPSGPYAVRLLRSTRRLPLPVDTNRGWASRSIPERNAYRSQHAGLVQSDRCHSSIRWPRRSPRHTG